MGFKVQGQGIRVLGGLGPVAPFSFSCYLGLEVFRVLGAGMRDEGPGGLGSHLGGLGPAAPWSWWPPGCGTRSAWSGLMLASEPPPPAESMER